MAALFVQLLFCVARRVSFVTGHKQLFAQDFYSYLNLDKSAKGTKKELLLWQNLASSKLKGHSPPHDAVRRSEVGTEMCREMC